MGLLCLLTSLILIVNTNEAARILGVFPTPSISHQVVFRPLIQELAKRGHDVTVITTDPAFPKGGAPANLTEIDVHDISYNIYQEIINDIPRGNKNDVIHQMEESLPFLTKIVDKQLNDEAVRRLIEDKNKKFDLLILEAWVRPALGFSYLYDAPVILMSSLGAMFDNSATVGAPTHPILYPSIFRQKLKNLSMWEKIWELYTHYKILDIHYQNRHFEDQILKKNFGPDIPSVLELNNKVDMLFLNVYPVFEGIRPVPPNVIYTGGLHQNQEKELPKDLKSYLDSSKNGVIYISFGTNVDPTQLPPERIQVLVKAFSQLPYDVLWKWNGDELPGRTENIRISKWLPQSDLLKHPKIKVFVTQGGLQSTDEAITAGVPLIGVPMLGDQWYNVEKYEYHKIGVRLDLDDITVENFKNTLLKVMGDESYRQNIIKLRGLMRDEVQTPLERAVWWTEYVLRHGGAKHLRSPAANISWWEYLELELVLTLLAGLVIIVTALVLILFALYKHFLKYAASIKVKRA
ncbi:UDP-glucuronosyltransferase 2B31-like [Trichoplusia ni]|uniref:UDP-glucuronosyltransferase n=1 Tax=Trichoplusia ni TaxID=7111 RepID=A0A7E5W4W2_TRINI|nr:UDP-glucuronosyltransferase 2B31-like [Trichoplusia ni]